MPSINSKYSILATGAVTCRTYTAARAGLALARHDSIVSQLSRIPHGEACLASHTTQPVSHPTRRGLHTRSPLCQTSTDRRALRSMHASRPGSAHVCPPQPHLHLGHVWGEQMSHCLAGRACTSRAHARRVRSPCVFSSANCAASFASARRRPSPPQHAGTLLVMSFAQCGMPAHPMLQAQLRGLATWHHSHPSHASSLWCCQPPHRWACRPVSGGASSACVALLCAILCDTTQADMQAVLPQWRPKRRTAGHQKRRTSNAAGAQAVADGQRDVVLGADVQDLVPVRERKVLSVVQEAQLRAAPPGVSACVVCGEGSAVGAERLTAGALARLMCSTTRRRGLAHRLMISDNRRIGLGSGRRCALLSGFVLRRRTGQRLVLELCMRRIM